MREYIQKLESFFNKIIPIFFPIILVYIVVCALMGVNIERKLFIAIENLFLFTVVTVSSLEIYEIITNNFKLKKALQRGAFILFSLILHTLIQPETMYKLKIHKPGFMIPDIEQHYTPTHAEKLQFKESVSSGLFVYLTLGEYKNHSTTKISSFTVYATIQVGGLNLEGADCKISWGENDSYNQFKVYNGGNHLMHSYASKGRKEVKYEILIPGKSEPIRDSKTIEIIGG